MSHGSKLENNLLCQQNGTDTQSTDDWLAIKTNKYKTTELVNIVSLSVEMEKISIVTREHNRVVTDDIETKQWYGIYTVEQLFLIHQHFCQINSDLDKYYPNQLKPIKGYLSTYFNKNLSQTICIEKANYEIIDLQDNFLCNSIKDYLKKCIEFIGVNLFVDILFNDLNSNDYFEIYSDFNLKRLQDEIDTAKELFGKIRTKDDKKKRIPKIDLSNEDYIWEFKRTLRNILLFYSQEDRLINQMLLLYAEYYNNLLKPLIDSNELAKKNLAKYEKKLASQLKTNKFLTDQSNTDALKELEEIVQKTEKEITDLSNDIDKLCIQYKQNIMELFVSMQENIKQDKFQFYLPKNNPYYCFFETVVKDRLSRFFGMESEMAENCDETIDHINDNSNHEFCIKRRGKGSVYDFCTAIPYSEFIKNFNVKLNNKGLVQMFECEKNKYKYKFKRKLKEDTKFYYQCSPWKETCLVSSYITIKNDHVSVFIEDEPHDHSTKNERGISEETKEAINKLYDVGVKAPKAILRSLDKQGFNCPMKSQLQNYLMRLRKDRMRLKNDDISKDCDQSILDVFKKDFYVDLPLYSASYQWISTIKTENIIKMRHDNIIYHFTSMTTEKALTREKVMEDVTISGHLLEKNLKENCHMPKITKTYLDKSNWQNSTCNCRYFLKNFICIHIIGLAFKYQLVDIPESARCMTQVDELEKTKASLFFDKSSSSDDDSDSEVLSNGCIKDIKNMSNGDMILENINRFKRSISAKESNEHELENRKKRGRPKKKF